MEYLIYDPSSDWPYNIAKRLGAEFKPARSLSIATEGTGEKKRYEIMEREGIYIVRLPDNHGCLGHLLIWLEDEYGHKNRRQD